MHVIWARGQVEGDYHHRPASGLDGNYVSPSDRQYYRHDELKYHGQDDSYLHRGFFTMNFFGRF